MKESVNKDNNQSPMGCIMQVQPFSVNDGDGIRTTIFMAGCPLRCKWCSNPEGFTAEKRTGWYKRKCIGCGACVKVCPEGIGIDMNEAVMREIMAAESDMHRALTGHEKCTACGKCCSVCPTGARSQMATYMSADDLLSHIHKHRLFYSYSGGGITFSGGEATMQIDFLEYLTREIYDLGYSMDIETCGMFDWDKTAHILARMDLIFMDLKMMNRAKHIEYTGMPNDLILENIARLSELEKMNPAASAGNSTDPDIVIRIPVIGGVNDDEENIRSSAAYVHRHVPNASIELLPYHSYGQIKYEALGIQYAHPEFTTPSRERMEELRNLIRAEGVDIADYR